MSQFESGVAEYLVGITTVRNHFPIDTKGNKDVRCTMCRFFSKAAGRCRLNDQICEYPEKYVGSHCPLEF